MSNSSLAKIIVPASTTNYTIGRSGRRIEYISLHHMAGILSARQCGSIFQQANRGASANYGVGKDGDIALYVDESNTSWANTNWDSNCKSVTIETSNCERGGDWKVSDKTLQSLIKLIADISKRNNIKLIKGKTLVWHSMYCKTICPGPYLLSKLDYIIEEANKINNASVVQTPKKGIEYRVHLKGGSWLPWVTKADNTNEGYAGIYGREIDGIQVKNRKYQAHTVGGSWLSVVSKVDESANGYAGIWGQSIDGIKVYNAQYRVHVKAKGNLKAEWLSWVTKVDGTNEGYAGYIGREIDGIQIK